MLKGKSSQEKLKISDLFYSPDFFQILVAINVATKTFYDLRWDDLHGCSVKQAKLRVFTAIKESAKTGCRTCRIITGRGNHANPTGQRGIIFKTCETWLNHPELQPLIESYEKRVGHYVVRINTRMNLSALEKEDKKIIEQFFQKNIDFIQKSADEGEPEAQFLLGCGYAIGVDRLNCHYKKAFQWLLKSANQHYGLAQEYVGMFYYIGEGVRQNDEKAIKWLKESVKNGQGRPAYILSSAYFYGFGCEISAKLSGIWAIKGANLGDVASMQRVANLYWKGYPEDGIPCDISKAIHWYKRAAKKGDPYSQFQLGFCHNRGKGVPVNLSEGFNWFLLSAKSGDSDAMMALARCYLNGSGCKKDINEAKKWIDKVDALSHPGTKLLLSQYYRKIGEIDKSLDLEKLAAKMGDIDAQFMLIFEPATTEAEKFDILTQMLKKPVDEITQCLPLFMQFKLARLLLLEAESDNETLNNNKRGIRLAQELIKEKYAEAALLLGMYFAQKDPQKAIEFWEKGAALGSTDCMFSINILCNCQSDIKNAKEKTKHYCEMAIEQKHPITLLSTAFDLNLDSSAPLDSLQLALRQLLDAFDGAIKEKKSNHTVLSLGVDIVIKQAPYELLKILLAQGYRIRSSESILQESLEKLRQLANEGNKEVQHCLGVYLISQGSPLQNHLEFAAWVENLIKEEPKFAEETCINLFLLFCNYNNKTNFIEGINWLFKAIDLGSDISDQTVKLITQNPFYKGQQVLEVSECIPLIEKQFKKTWMGINQLINQKLESHERYLFKCYSQEGGLQVKNEESELSELLIDTNIMATLTHNFSQLMKRDIPDLAEEKMQNSCTKLQHS